MHQFQAVKKVGVKLERQRVIWGGIRGFDIIRRTGKFPCSVGVDLDR